MKVNILTDSTADLTKEQMSEHDINVYPLNIYFGEEEYIDGVTMISYLPVRNFLRPVKFL